MTRFLVLAFSGSFLAFWLELAAAKLLLPRFGGGAFVWTGASLAFQALLLGAYLYARRAGPKLHAAALLAPLLLLPPSLPAPLAGVHPLAELLYALLRCAGAPFFVLTTTVVVAQRRLAELGEDAKGSYSLFAASNAGAFCALGAYPLVIEPLLSLPAQTSLFAALYCAYAALAWPLRPRRAAAAAFTPEPREAALWLLLSAAPCAATLATTALLSHDFAAVPLLWIAPLAVYLLTFVLAFRTGARRSGGLAAALLPFALAWVVVCSLALAGVGGGSELLARVVDLGKFGYLLFALFAVATVFHRSLADARPEASAAIGSFYAWVAAGGLLGSAVVALAVPVLGRRSASPGLDWVAAGILAGAALAVRDWPSLSKRPKFAALLAAGLAASGWAVSRAGNRPGLVEARRSLYGVHVVRDEDDLRRLSHGATEHGAEKLVRKARAEPLAYFARSGPLGEAWKELGAGRKSVAVVGLGAGSIAAYPDAGARLDFYELDADVAAVARGRFSFLAESRADVRVILGDARLSLSRSTATYDLIVLDAFTGGAIPVHLLTNEAFALYAKRLNPGGSILVHVSNRYLDLRPVIAAAARGLGWPGAEKRRLDAAEPGTTPSAWAALGKDPAAIARLEKRGWVKLASGFRGWTDAHASLLPILDL